MNLKKISILIVILVLVLLGVYVFISINKDTTNDIIYEPNTQTEILENNETIQEIEFLKSISGVKANDIELIDNPVGIKGEFVAPRESILRGVDYFLQHTKNDKMENVKVDIGKGYISIRVDYNIIKNITTPIEVKVIPSLNVNKDLELKIQEVKFLDLKISDWLVNIALKSFIKDWFPKGEDINIDFKEGSVIIYKDNFKGISIDKLKVESSALNINMTIDLNTILSDINSTNK